MMSNNSFTAQMYIVGVVVTNESNMVSYFPKEGNLNGVMLTCIVMWLGSRVTAWVICLTLDLASDLVLLLFPPLLSTTGHHVGFNRDYNSHSAFRGVLHHYA